MEMTKQEQINEIAKYMCNVCDFKCDSFLSGEFCAAVMENAEQSITKQRKKTSNSKPSALYLTTNCATRGKKQSTF